MSQMNADLKKHDARFSEPWLKSFYVAVVGGASRREIARRFGVGKVDFKRVLKMAKPEGTA